jgi:hypothetical protein
MGGRGGELVTELWCWLTRSFDAFRINAKVSEPTFKINLWLFNASLQLQTHIMLGLNYASSDEEDEIAAPPKKQVRISASNPPNAQGRIATNRKDSDESEHSAGLD